MRTSRAVRAIITAICSVLPCGFAQAQNTVAPQACQILMVESLDMETAPTGEFLVPVTLNNRPYKLLVDTGSVLSSISGDVAQQLGLPMLLAFGGGSFINGSTTNRYAMLDSIAFGRLHSTRRWPVVIDPDAILTPTQSGLVGPDVMSNYDVELDFLAGKMNFFAANTCATPVYWANEYSQVPMNLNAGSQILIDAMLDGKPVKVFLDTGSPTSVMSLDAARSLFGWRDDDPRVIFKHTVPLNGGAPTPFYGFPFASLNFGGVTVQNPKISLIPKANFSPNGRDDAQVILGMSVIRQLHLMMAYKEKTLYLTAAEASRTPPP